jgi:hypothetical protein
VIVNRGNININYIILAGFRLVFVDRGLLFTWGRLHTFYCTLKTSNKEAIFLTEPRNNGEAIGVFLLILRSSFFV